MKATRSLHGTPKLEFDLGTYLQQLWRHVDEREKRQASPADAYRKVRLDCTGQFVDIESIGLVVVRSSTADIETVEFLCPQCERLHESLRLT